MEAILKKKCGRKLGSIPWNKLDPEEKRRRNRERCRARYSAKKEEYSSKMKAWSKENKELVKRRHQEYYAKNKSDRLKKNKEYVSKNWNSILKKKNEWTKERKKTDPNFKLRFNLRERVRSAVRAKKTFKRAGTKSLVGCEVSFLMKYLESLWLPGMTWENYGVFGWHIDHVKPCSLFDLTSEEEQRKCFHYTNLQPLWAADNLSKGAKYKIEN